MHLNRISLVCPYLLGNNDGLMCDAATDFIRNIKDINIEICLSRRFESCYIYFSRLQEMNVLQKLPSGRESETVFQKNNR
jgi:hypothetical protein